MVFLTVVMVLLLCVIAIVNVAGVLVLSQIKEALDSEQMKAQMDKLKQ